MLAAAVLEDLAWQISLSKLSSTSTRKSEETTKDQEEKRKKAGDRRKVTVLESKLGR